MKIATWNVNSIKMRAEQVVSWLTSTAVDVLVMQETKTTDDAFPASLFEAAGYDVVFDGQKTYNGVAMAVKKGVAEVSRVTRGIPGYPNDQKRFIAADLTTQDGSVLTVAGVYVPNGQEVASAKYLYKLDWLAALTRWARQATADDKQVVVAGDFNIAPTDADVWNTTYWKDKILVSVPERSALTALKGAGLNDAWEIGLHAPDTFSWWDYRQSGFEKNHGLRIDLMLGSASLLKRVTDVTIDTAPRAAEKPSDHAPVVMTLL